MNIPKDGDRLVIDGHGGTVKSVSSYFSQEHPGVYLAVMDDLVDLERGAQVLSATGSDEGKVEGVSGLHHDGDLRFIQYLVQKRV